MRALWPTVIAPLLDACRPTTIVELGSGEEAFEEMLAERAGRYGSTVQRGAGSTLDEVAPEFALVHGEPNWHTVSERLDRLAEMARAGGAPFPLTLVHGVDWPTGRRDSYPNPTSIPLGARQPHRAEDGVERALDAHDRRNGVLTAVEDFLDRHGSDDDLESIHVPGLGGTAILISRRRLEADGSGNLAGLLDGWRLSPQALAQLAAVEAERVHARAEIEKLCSELETARAGIATQSSAELDALRDRIEELAQRQAELTEALARRDARLAALEGDDTAPVAFSPTAQLALALRTAGEVAGLGEASQPLPLDRRRILLGEGEPCRPGSDPMHAIVRATGDTDRLRRCLWSLLDRTDRPLRLTLTIDSTSGPELRELARAVAGAEPRVRLAEGEPDDDRSEWRLRIDSPVIFAHGAVRNLLAAARRQGSPQPMAAISADAIAVPGWAGASALALLLGGEARKRAEAAAIAAPCVVLPPGTGPDSPADVALDAVVEDGREGERDPSLAGLSWLAEAFRDEQALAAAMRERLRESLAIAYVLPGMPQGGSGGSHSVFQEVLTLSSFGLRARVLVESSFAERARELYPESAELVEPYGTPRAFARALDGFDVVVATQAPSARLVEEYVRGRAGITGAYYIQDYEPLFSPPGSPSADAALLSYRQGERLLMFAKTHWIGNVVVAAHGVPVAKVSPSLDNAVFNAIGRKGEPAPIRVLAMTRPRTPRRRPAETLAALARLKRELGARIECLSFGCGVEELEALPRADGVEHLGVLSRTGVAAALRRCDLFLDLSAYQAFGRTGLEAMACGAVPILPEVGGTVEYAVDDWNGMLVDSTDEDEVVAATRALVDDPGRLERLRANGIETAGAFSLSRAASSQYACFAARHLASREAS
jgi:glycosyltransferase involved in cell wall biosynthesis